MIGQITNPLAAAVFALASLAAIAILLRRSYRYFGRRSKASGPIEAQPRPGPSAARRPHDAPDELLKAEVQLHETARELSARLDCKMIALEVLLRESQATIQRLESLLAQAEGGVANGEHGLPTEDSACNAAPASDTRHVEVFRLADAGYSPVTIANRLSVSLEQVQRVLGTRPTAP